MFRYLVFVGFYHCLNATIKVLSYN